MRGAEGLPGGQGQPGIAVRTCSCIVRGVKIQRQLRHILQPGVLGL